MKTGWKITLGVVGTLVIGGLVFGFADAMTAKHRPGGKRTCAVVGLAQGVTVFGGEHSSIWLECPEMKRKRAIEVRVTDPKKFTVGGRAQCSLFQAFTGISERDITARNGLLEDCEPTS